MIGRARNGAEEIRDIALSVQDSAIASYSEISYCGSMASAAALIIGNEILSGKTEERNVHLLARELFAHGIPLQRVVVCGDVESDIIRDVRALADVYDVVFTSGGVGPTHDDITIPAIARAFGEQVTHHADLTQKIRDHFGEKTTAGHLRMAEMPESGEYVYGSRSEWPVLRMRNIYVLPGVPEIFKHKLAIAKEHIARGDAFHSIAVFTHCDEGEIAALLARIEIEHSGVAIGSYPLFPVGEYSVKVTFDGIDRARLERAANLFVESIGVEKFVRLV